MGEGALCPPCNFSVSYGRRTKFGNMGYFDVLSSKMALVFKFKASIHYDVIIGKWKAL